MGDIRVSFIVPVMDEIWSLQETVDVIYAVARKNVGEILIVVSKKTTTESKKMIKKLQEVYGDEIIIYQQQEPGLGRALAEAIGVSRYEYVMLMSSDLETDPRIIPQFVKKMSEGKWDIVKASRWLSGGGFENYGWWKVKWNWLFQKMVAGLYGVKLTDLTYAYLLFRREVIDGIRWKESTHSFLLECLLVPLKRGARVVEIPCQWKARQEGKSHGEYGRGWRYLWLAVRLRIK